MIARPLRLLMCASDMGGGQSIAPVARRALADGRFEVRIIADEPAAGYLRDMGIDCRRVTPRLDESVNAIKAAKRALADWPCDAVLTGVNGFGTRLDEAVLEQAPPTPTHAIQDFWGFVNLNLGRGADVYFVIDEFAKAVTEGRCSARAIPVGSLKHAGFAEFDSGALRASYRRLAGIEDETPLVVVYGQPLWDVAGFEETLATFAKMLNRAGPAHHAVYRPHPDEGDDGEKAAVVLRQNGGNWKIVGEGAIEEAAAASDLACSVCSSTNFDQAMLNRSAPGSLGVPLYLMTDPRLRAWFAESCGYDRIPLVDQGIAVEARSEDELVDILTRAFDSEFRDRYWEGARTLAESAGAPGRVLDAIAARVAARPGDDLAHGAG